MRRFLKFALVGALAGFAGWFCSKYDVQFKNGLSVKPRAAVAAQSLNSGDLADSETGVLAVGAAPRGGRDTLRIAAYNLQSLGAAKLSSPRVTEVLSNLISRFDIMAIEDIRSRGDDVLPRLTAAANAAGRHYDFVVGPRVGRNGQSEQFAYLFDRDTVEVDRAGVYTLADPDRVLNRDPLVAWFRAKGPNPKQAFTFTLVAVHCDTNTSVQENDSLANVFRAVRDDGRREDDVIMLGDFNADSKHLGLLGRLPHLEAAVSGMPSTTRRDRLVDNLLFNASATVEFTGRAGVVDMVREYNLSTEQALEISDHFPVWAEFSSYEGRTHDSQLAALTGRR